MDHIDTLLKLKNLVLGKTFEKAIFKAEPGQERNEFSIFVAAKVVDDARNIPIDLDELDNSAVKLSLNDEKLNDVLRIITYIQEFSSMA